MRTKMAYIALLSNDNWPTNAWEEAFPTKEEAVEKIQEIVKSEKLGYIDVQWFEDPEEDAWDVIASNRHMSVVYGVQPANQ